MADVAKITIPSGTYNIKDATARSLIDALGSPMRFRGIATDTVTDGGTENPTISGYNFDLNVAGGAPLEGDTIIDSSKKFEYVWVQTTSGSTVAAKATGRWEQFGDLSDLGDFAYADTGKGTVYWSQIEGLISSATVSSGATGTLDIKTTTKAITLSGSNTPQGSVNTTADVAITGLGAGSLTYKESTQTGYTYTAATETLTFSENASSTNSNVSVDTTKLSTDNFVKTATFNGTSSTYTVSGNETIPTNTGSTAAIGGASVTISGSGDFNVDVDPVTTP